MHKPKVIRCGKAPQKTAAITAEEVECLQNFWELEEQLGLREKPQDNLLKQIPQIKRNVRARDE